MNTLDDNFELSEENENINDDENKKVVGDQNLNRRDQTILKKEKYKIFTHEFDEVKYMYILK